MCDSGITCRGNTTIGFVNKVEAWIVALIFLDYGSRGIGRAIIDRQHFKTREVLLQ